MKLVIEIDDVRYKDIQRIASVQLENYHFKTAEQIIANGTPLSSVEPERKPEVKNPVMPHGYWIHDDDWECSVCHSHISESKFMANDYGTPIYNYCHICGADITGV